MNPDPTYTWRALSGYETRDETETETRKSECNCTTDSGVDVHFPADALASSSIYKEVSQAPTSDRFTTPVSAEENTEFKYHDPYYINSGQTPLAESLTADLTDGEDLIDETKTELSDPARESYLESTTPFHSLFIGLVDNSLGQFLTLFLGLVWNLLS